MSSVYQDQATVRIRVYLKDDGRIGRIDGPPTGGQNGSQELRMRPDMHGEFKLIGRYDVMGTYIPFFPHDLNGQAGIDGWLALLKQHGFTVTEVKDA